MVDEQLKSRGIKDLKVLKVISELPRHEFIPNDYLANAYADYPISIGEGQTISQPYIVALMTERLKLTGQEKVLEIGTGSGYQTAILATLSREVYSVERIKSLAEMATRQLEKMGFTNIKIKVGDGSLGWEEYAPFDRIIVTAAAPQIPDNLIRQLADKGIMIIPVGGSFSQILTRVKRHGSDIKSEDVCGCVFVPLVGKYGYKEQ